MSGHALDFCVLYSVSLLLHLSTTMICIYNHGARTNSLAVESGVPRANYRDRENEDQQISWITKRSNDNIKIMGKLKKQRKRKTKFSEISQEDFVPQ
jgi:hypothetical protein